MEEEQKIHQNKIKKGWVFIIFVAIFAVCIVGGVYIGLSKTVSGTVVDLTGQPLPNARVSSGIFHTTSTDDGTFTVRISRWNNGTLTVQSQEEEFPISIATLNASDSNPEAEVEKNAVPLSYESPNSTELFGEESDNITSDQAVFEEEIENEYHPNIDPATITVPTLSEPIELPPPPAEFIVNDEGFEVAKGEIVIGWQEEMTSDQRTAIIQQVGAKQLFDDPVAHTSIALVEDQRKVTSVISLLQESEGVVAAMENYRLEPDVAPNDPDWSNKEKSWWLKKLNAEPAWAMTAGNSRVIVAVIDAGFQLDHPDLAGAFTKIVFNYSAGQIDEKPRHGTHVSGIIAARKDNSLGLSGIAPRVRILPIRLDDFGRLPSVYTMLKTFPNVRIATMSMGWNWSKINRRRIANGKAAFTNEQMQAHSDTFDRIVRPAFLEYYQRGGVMCKSAGNDSGMDAKMNLLNFSEVITVAASNADGSLANFSNNGESVDIAAPGAKIWSTVDGSTYDFLSGTSMATPTVCGTVAAIRSVRPNYGALVIERLLKRYSRPPEAGAPNAYPQLDTWRALLGATKMYGVTGEVLSEEFSPLQNTIVATEPSMWNVVTNTEGEFVIPYLQSRSYTLKARIDKNKTEATVKPPAFFEDRVVTVVLLSEKEEEDEDDPTDKEDPALNTNTDINADTNTPTSNSNDNTETTTNNNTNAAGSTGTDPTNTDSLTGGTDSAQETQTLSNGIVVSAEGCAVGGFEAPTQTAEGAGSNSCPAGFYYSRETIACEQEICPPSSIGRTYTLECKCAEGDRGIYACDIPGYLVACVAESEF